MLIDFGRNHPFHKQVTNPNARSVRTTKHLVCDVKEKKAQCHQKQNARSPVDIKVRKVEIKKCKRY